MMFLGTGLLLPSLPKRAMLASLTVLIASMVVLAEDVAGNDVPKAANPAKKTCNCEGVWPNPCGLACLRFAMKHFGIEGSNEAAVGSAADDKASGIDQIQTACERAGLHVRQVRLNIHGLERLLNTHPSVRVILSLKKGHFGYVEAAGEGRFRFITLSGDARWCPAEKLAAHWPGDAVVISRGSLPNDLTEIANAGIAMTTDTRPLRLVYFHSPSCYECQEVKKFLPQVTSCWGDRIAVELRNVEDINIFNELFKYEKYYKATVAAPPAIFVGDKALVGDKAILKQLNVAIADSLANSIATFSPEPASSDKAALTQQEAVPSEILRRFESYGPGAVAVAGLIDGVNPCAFTTIVFFLSMLAYLGKSKRDLAVVGIGFTATMFVTYFLMGLGLLGAIKSFSVSSGLSSGLACGVGVLAFVLAGWSFWDFVQYKRTGDTKKMTLGLPKSVKARIHKVIRKGLTTRGLVVGSVSVGFLVAVLESLCTGQVYLPTIVFVTRVPGLRSAAIGYLLLYNLMFILPLVGILIIGYLGVKSEYMGNFLHRHLAAFKLGMAGVFVLMGILVIITL